MEATPCAPCKHAVCVCVSFLPLSREAECAQATGPPREGGGGRRLTEASTRELDISVRGKVKQKELVGAPEWVFLGNFQEGSRRKKKRSCL